MTDKQTPTDAELEALLLDKLPASKHYIRPVIEKMVAAMQAAIDKWGQPAQETNGRKVFVCTHCDGVYADQPVTQCDCLPDENTFTEGWICFGAPAQAAEPVAWLSPWRKDQVTTDYDAYGKHGIPLYTAPQPVAREPMTNAHIRAMLNKHPPKDVCDWSYRMGIDDAELHHGIKGGQHGTE